MRNIKSYYKKVILLLGVCMMACCAVIFVSATPRAHSTDIDTIEAGALTSGVVVENNVIISFETPSNFDGNLVIESNITGIGYRAFAGNTVRLIKI